MRKWIVRFVSLLVFNVAVLLVIGWLTPARVGWAAIWAGVILTVATIWIKPLITKLFTSMAAKSASQRTKAGEKVVQFFLVLLVAFVVWILTVLLSGVSVGGWFWGYVLPPVILWIGWLIYDAIDDRVEAHADALYTKATGGGQAGHLTTEEADAERARQSLARESGRREIQDGLSDEQRRMLDGLEKPG